MPADSSNRTLEHQAPAFRILECSDAGPETLNIFIHGFFAAPDEQGQQRLIQTLRTDAAFADSSNWLILWNSGSLRDALKTATSSTVVQSSLASRSWPLMGAALLYTGWRYFKSHEYQADRLGAALWQGVADKIVQEQHRFTRINLIGHSLGARVLVRSLAQQQIRPHYLPIQDVILLAAALDRAQDWPAVLAGIGGQLINCHSRQDMVLAFKPDLERCAGRHPIAFEHERLINHPLALSHLDYWKQLPAIMAALAPYRRKRITSG
ncbi:MAG: DUF726 domain-containing protein [Thiothrix sp.]|nr:DUF726 domain-containing protein [Thiothrix sp.]HPE59881.1 DUF726 domain-containing protein [Thiolinea sp.]